MHGSRFKWESSAWERFPCVLAMPGSYLILVTNAANGVCGIFFSSITCEGNFLTINVKSTKVLKSSCVILRGKIPWPKMLCGKK